MNRLQDGLSADVARRGRRIHSVEHPDVTNSAQGTRMTPNWLQQIGETIATEFSDLPDAGQATRVMLRLLLAALLGGPVPSTARGGARVTVRRVRVEPWPGSVRHCSRRSVSGPARRKRRRHRQRRVRGLRHWRAECRRADRPHVRDRRRNRATASCRACARFATAMARY